MYPALKNARWRSCTREWRAGHPENTGFVKGKTILRFLRQKTSEFNKIKADTPLTFEYFVEEGEKGKILLLFTI